MIDAKDNTDEQLKYASVWWMLAGDEALSDELDEELVRRGYEYEWQLSPEGVAIAHGIVGDAASLDSSELRKLLTDCEDGSPLANLVNNILRERAASQPAMIRRLL